MADDGYLAEDYAISRADRQRYTQAAQRFMVLAKQRQRAAQQDHNDDEDDDDDDDDGGITVTSGGDSDDDDDDDDTSNGESIGSETSSIYAALKAQEEWEENVRQLQLAVSVLIVPSIGKWLGRRWAYSRR